MMGGGNVKIYIDSDYKCHTSAAENRRAVETDFFDGKCKQFIEGYRYVPMGETWVRFDGKVFSGEMISPHIDYNELEKAQLIYEKEQAEEIAKILLGENI